MFGRKSVKSRRGDYAIVGIGYRTGVARYRNDQIIGRRAAHKDEGFVFGNEIFAFIDKRYRFFVSSLDVPLISDVTFGVVSTDGKRYEIVRALGFYVFGNGTRPVLRLLNDESDGDGRTVRIGRIFVRIGATFLAAGTIFFTFTTYIAVMVVPFATLDTDPVVASVRVPGVFRAALFAQSAFVAETHVTGKVLLTLVAQVIGVTEIIRFDAQSATASCA